jgi:hypothetical protein
VVPIGADAELGYQKEIQSDQCYQTSMHRSKPPRRPSSSCLQPENVRFAPMRLVRPRQVNGITHAYDLICWRALEHADLLSEHLHLRIPISA